MDETILVPSRLLDRQVGDSTDSVLTPPETPKHIVTTKKKANVRDLLNQSDLFNLYNMLNSVKTDLLWCRNGADDDDAVTPVVEVMPALDEAATPTAAAEKESTPTGGDTAKGHNRRPSTVSMISTNSAASTISDSESDISNENDSGIESESTTTEHSDKSTEMAKQFRHHLLGLYKSLEQMTEAANYLAARYQSDVGPV